MYVCLHVYEHMYVCMYVCMYACMHVCELMYMWDTDVSRLVDLWPGKSEQSKKL